jgi:hypothetical protein
MNSALMMTEPKNAMNGSSNGDGKGNGHGAVINALRKLYDPVLEEPIPDFLLHAAAMTREEALARSGEAERSEASQQLSDKAET